MKFLASLLITLAIWSAAPASAMENSQTYFIGDSIGFGMSIAGHLDFDYVNAEIGRTMEAGFDIIDTLNLSGGDKLTIELGTNNLTTPESWYLISNIVALIPQEVCVTWVTPSYFHEPWRAVEFRSALIEQLSNRDCWNLVEWGRLGNVTMTHDTVHPNEFGSWYLAALLQPNVGPLWV